MAQKVQIEIEVLNNQAKAEFDATAKGVAEISDKAAESATKVKKSFEEVGKAQRAAFASQESKKILEEQNKALENNIQSISALARGLDVLFKQEQKLIAANKQNTAEFKRNQEEGKRVRKQYDELRLAQRLQAEETAKASEETVTLRTELRALKNELALLEEQGKKESKQFQELAIEAAKLETAISNTDKRIQSLASATFVFDAAVDSARALAGGFAVAQGAIALFAEENEDLQKAIVKTNAALAILNGLQEIANFLSGQSAGKIAAQTIAQKAYAIAVGNSTGAMKAFRLALAGTGVGLLVFALYELVSAFSDTKEATEEQIESNKKLQQSYDELTNSVQSAGARLNKARNEQLVLEGKLSESVAERINLQIDANEEIARVNEEAQKKETERLEQFREAIKKDASLRKVEQRLLSEDLRAIEEERATLERAIRLELSNEIKRLDKERVKSQKRTQFELTELETKGVETRLSVIQAAAKKQLQLLNLPEEAQQKAVEQFASASRATISILQGEIAEREKLNLNTFEQRKQLLIEQNILDRFLAEQNISDVKEQNAEIFRLNQQLNKDLNELEKERNDDLIQQVFDYVFAVGQAFNQIADLQKELAERRIAQIERIKEVELAAIEVSSSSEAQKQREREALEVRTTRKIIEEKRKIAKLDKATGIFDAVVNTAVAITNAQKQKPPLNIILTAAASVIGATQIAKISSEPLPQFGSGGIADKGGLLKGKSHKEGGIPIEVEGGEFIVNKRRTKPHMKELVAMNTSRTAYDKLIQDMYVRPKLEQFALEYSKSNQAVNVNASLNSAQMETELKALRRETKRTGKVITTALGRTSSSRYNWN